MVLIVLNLFIQRFQRFECFGFLGTATAVDKFPIVIAQIRGKNGSQLVVGNKLFQLYLFGGRAKLIICQIRHELSVTIHEISIS